MAMNKTEKKRFDAAIRLIKAYRNPDVDTRDAKSDIGMYSAQRELKESIDHAREVGLDCFNN